MGFSVPNFQSLLSSSGIDRSTQRLLSGMSTDRGSYVTTNIKGLRELDAALKQLPEHVVKKVLRKTMREAGDIVKKRAIELAPSNPKVPLNHPEWRTLHLREGILARVSIFYPKGNAGATVQAAIGLDKKHAFFGRFVERGFIHASRTSLFGRRGGRIYKPGAQIPPHPFMRPALESTKDIVRAFIIQRLRQGIDLAAKQFYRKAA